MTKALFHNELAISVLDMIMFYTYAPLCDTSLGKTKTYNAHS